MTAEGQFIIETNAMRIRLEDHLLTLEELRDSQKHAALVHYGLSAAPELYSGVTRQVVESHRERYDEHMSTLSRYAHIVLAYIFLEDRMRAFGEAIAVTGRGNAFDDRRGNTSLLDNFANYLESMSISVPIPEEVTALHLIRLCIVHGNGQVAEMGASRAEELRCYIANCNGGVQLDSRGCVALTTEACLEIQGAAFDYLNEVRRAAGFSMFIPPEVRRNFEQHILPHLHETG